MPQACYTSKQTAKYLKFYPGHLKTHHTTPRQSKTSVCRTFHVCTQWILYLQLCHGYPTYLTNKHRWLKKRDQDVFSIENKGKSIHILWFQEPTIITFNCLHLTLTSATKDDPQKKTRPKWNGEKDFLDHLSIIHLCLIFINLHQDTL